MEYVYLWADGIHVNIRLEENKLCLLVVIGVRADGGKGLIALADGYRESFESWADLPRDCARRGMRAPVLAVGDGALGFWNALREVFPQAREGRCWFHKTANVLAALPKSAQPGAKKALAEIWGAEGKEHARVAVKASMPPAARSSPRPSRRSPTMRRNCWPSTTTRASTGCTCAHQPDQVHFRHGPPSCQDHQRPGVPGPLAWPWRSSSSSLQDRWCAVNAPHLVALVRAEAIFINGKLAERPDGQTQPEAA